MGKLKIKKNDVWIDMTPMSDVMVLLLTFFMLSANFVKNEVVKVQTPSSQTESKVPKNATLDIMIKPDTLNKGTAQEKVIGRVFIGTDKVATMDSALTILAKVNDTKQVYKKAADAMNEEARKNFLAETQLGIAMKDLPGYLTKPHSDRTKDLEQGGLSLDSVIEVVNTPHRDIKPGMYSEFQLWVRALRGGYKQWHEKYAEENPAEAAEVPDKLEVCIKADRETPYVTFKTVISELQDLNISKYKLLTQYKKPVEEKGK